MSKFRRRSFTETVEGRRRFFGRLLLFIVVFVAFEAVSGLFLGAYAVSSATMEPTISPGDRLLASPLPFGPRTVFGKIPPFARPSRGDLVLIYPPYVNYSGFFAVAADSLVRFLSFQRLSILNRGSEEPIEGPFVERVIGLPGDELAMVDFVFKVRPAGTDHSLTEFEFSASRYDIQKPSRPAGWSEADPLSGSMRSIYLGKDEYFLAMDDRGSVSDSRAWGPLGISHFKGRILLRFWPFGRFGGF